MVVWHFLFLLLPIHMICLYIYFIEFNESESFTLRLPPPVLFSAVYHLTPFSLIQLSRTHWRADETDVDDLNWILYIYRIHSLSLSFSFSTHKNGKYLKIESYLCVGGFEMGKRYFFWSIHTHTHIHTFLLFTFFFYFFVFVSLSFFLRRNKSVLMRPYVYMCACVCIFMPNCLLFQLFDAKKFQISMQSARLCFAMFSLLFLCLIFMYCSF